tara:strand:- start:3858 stop:4226 length:369 start_codon:yes stop_codon:yes gene_type:complete
MYIIPNVDVRAFDHNGEMDCNVYFADLPSNDLPPELSKDFLRLELDIAEISISINKEGLRKHVEGNLEAKMSVINGDLSTPDLSISISYTTVDKLRSTIHSTVDIEYELLEVPTIIQVEALG